MSTTVLGLLTLFFCNGSSDVATRMDNQKGMSISFETFTWKIENFSKQNTKKLQSKAFRIRGYKWYREISLKSKILLFNFRYTKITISLKSICNFVTSFQISLMVQCLNVFSLFKRIKRLSNGPTPKMTFHSIKTYLAKKDKK